MILCLERERKTDTQTQTTMTAIPAPAAKEGVPNERGGEVEREGGRERGEEEGERERERERERASQTCKMATYFQVITTDYSRVQRTMEHDGKLLHTQDL